MSEDEQKYKEYVRLQSLGIKKRHLWKDKNGQYFIEYREEKLLRKLHIGGKIDGVWWENANGRQQKYLWSRYFTASYKKLKEIQVPRLKYEYWIT